MKPATLSLPTLDKPRGQIRVLVVDDSVTARDLLAYIVNRDAALQVIGVAENGRGAVGMACRLRPDVVVMDVNMPDIDGYTATQQIMTQCPTRIVLVTAHQSVTEIANTFRTVEVGALALLRQPVAPTHCLFEEDAKLLVDTIKLMSEVSVVRRIGHPESDRTVRQTPTISPSSVTIRLVAMGASTGGPAVLQAILAQLPADFSIPILIVQHIARGFAGGFATWLDQSCLLAVKLAEQGERPRSGHVYVAPDDVHLTLGNEGQMLLMASPRQCGLRPAVACLFSSVARHCGAHAVGVLLTGMGRDGAQELGDMKRAGAITLVQNAETAAINGMPGAAVELGAASFVMAPDDIAATLLSLQR
ncbi:chemotaxis-specific protein-glutamate methyltransferase CheB [Chitinivorax sp. B]|uniref:chemotaxis-specific protein-glutamate methyltransferase CheB n=1 Tax=Chitinivorax sp. B TaxID=2502235 RepID=UPI0010F4B7B7|nr:chemotaxis-specific protein-glutamate methyltransferase CheB [Chitinivorax sp. B]